MVVEADKNLGLCLIEKEEYFLRIRDELARSPDSYKPLPFDEETLHRRRRANFVNIARIIGYMKPEIGSKKIRDYILEPLNYPFKLCRIQAMPKLHKEGNRVRLIFPMRNHPLGNLHRFIAKSLSPLVLRQKSVITNVMEIVDFISGRVLNGKCIIATADIASMYPNIDRPKALKIAQRELDNPEFQCFRSHSDWNWRQLLEAAHQDMEFALEDSLFEQTKGVPIGSPAGPQLAMLALHNQLQEKWNLLSEKMLFGGIYFDDFLGVFKETTTKEEVRNDLIQLLSHTSLHFDEKSFDIKTAEELTDSDFTILDININTIKQDDGKFQCKVRPHCKEMGAYQYVPWTSAHPPATKRGIIKGELLRRLRLSDSLEDWQSTCADLLKKLLNRGYPLEVLTKEIAKISFDQSKQLRQNLIDKLKRRRAQAKFPFTGATEIPSGEPTIPLIIRYDPTSLRVVKKRRREIEEVVNSVFDETDGQPGIKKVRIVTAFTTGKRLGALLQKKKESSEP